jgi:hypothetical protein
MDPEAELDPEPDMELEPVAEAPEAEPEPELEPEIPVTLAIVPLTPKDESAIPLPTEV